VVYAYLWYPAEAPAADAPKAVYNQWPLPFSTTSDDWYSSTGRTVYQDLPVAPGPWPLILFSSGGGGAAFAHIYEGAKFASHGVHFVAMTHVREGNLGVPGVPTDPPDVRRKNRVLDVKYLLDVLLEWNQRSDHPFYQTIDTGAIFGGGHSLGGRTMVAATSRFE